MKISIETKFQHGKLAFFKSRDYYVHLTDPWGNMCAFPIDISEIKKLETWLSKIKKKISNENIT